MSLLPGETPGAEVTGTLEFCSHMAFHSYPVFLCCCTDLCKHVHVWDFHKEIFLKKQDHILIFLYFKKRTYFFTLGRAGSCHAWAFSSLREQGLLFVLLCSLPGAVASLVAELGLQALASAVAVQGLGSCGPQALECGSGAVAHAALLLCATWKLPGPGINPVTPALTGRFSTTSPPGKTSVSCLSKFLLKISACHLLSF